MKILAASIKHSIAKICKRVFILTVIDGDRKEVKN
jgi:hypothetical protein